MDGKTAKWRTQLPSCYTSLFFEFIVIGSFTPIMGSILVLITLR